MASSYVKFLYYLVFSRKILIDGISKMLDDFYPTFFNPETCQILLKSEKDNNIHFFFYHYTFIYIYI